MGSLLIPLLGSVAAKAGDALVGELLRAWGLDKSRRKLERHLAAVQLILLDADIKSRTNPVVRRWMTDLKTAAYRADDVLDDFCSAPPCCTDAPLPHGTQDAELLHNQQPGYFPPLHEQEDETCP